LIGKKYFSIVSFGDKAHDLFGVYSLQCSVLPYKKWFQHKKFGLGLNDINLKKFAERPAG
jgi:hypothetical protein